MTFFANPAMWASLGALLSAIGLEMIPAQQIGEHVIAAIAGISGIVGIVHALWQRHKAPVAPIEPHKIG